MVAQAQRMMETNVAQPLTGLATLMSMVYHGADLTALTQRLLASAALDDASALLDLATLVQLRGDAPTGLALQSQALALQQLYQLRPTTVHNPQTHNPIQLLAIMAPGDLMSNTPLEFLAEGAGLNLDLLYLSPDLPFPKQLPEHDLAIVAVSELDRNRATLALIEHALPHWPRPVLNHPNAIAQLSRDATSRTLESRPGILAPLTARIQRPILQQIGARQQSLANCLNGADFPIIIRPIDSHAGLGLQRITSASDINSYLQTQLADEFFISRFVDYRSPDGQFRKFRIMLIGGQPYLAHMAVSEHWMIHYLNAGMAEFAHKRQEEDLAMTRFAVDFLPRHAQALQTIHDLMGLDYLGIDCAETADGNLLIFEVGNSMVVHAMESPTLFPYKGPQMQKLFNGFKQMLYDRINSNDSHQPYTLLRSAPI